MLESSFHVIRIILRTFHELGQLAFTLGLSVHPKYE